MKNVELNYAHVSNIYFEDQIRFAYIDFNKKKSQHINIKYHILLLLLWDDRSKISNYNNP
jgi:hypothetical protein